MFYKVKHCNHIVEIIYLFWNRHFPTFYTLLFPYYKLSGFDIATLRFSVKNHGWKYELMDENHTNSQFLLMDILSKEIYLSLLPLVAPYLFFIPYLMLIIPHLKLKSILISLFACTTCVSIEIKKRTSESTSITFRDFSE